MSSVAAFLATSQSNDNLCVMRFVIQLNNVLRTCRNAVVLTVLALTMLDVTAVTAQSARGPHYNSIAVIIGNQRYRHTTPVIYAENDARAIRRYLVDRLGFRNDNILMKADLGREQMETLFGEPDRADGEIMDRIQERRLENRGDVFIYYSGHGVPDPDAAQDDVRRAFLLPVDVNQARISQAAFPIDKLYKKLEVVRGQLPVDRKVVLMLDACFSGRTPIARGGQPGRQATAGEPPDASIFQFSRGSFSVRADEPTAGIVRLVAATGDQVAYWDTTQKLGLFTSLFLRGVGGEADGTEFGNGDRIVTGDELMRFLEERVPAEARRRHQRSQRPTLDSLDRFSWTLPQPGQIGLPPVVPVPLRTTPAALPAALPVPAPAVAAPAMVAPIPPVATPPQRAARAAPRPVIDDEEIVRTRPRPRPRSRPVVEPRPRARASRPTAPRETSGGGCRTINGVRFCG